MLSINKPNQPIYNDIMRLYLRWLKNYLHLPTSIIRSSIKSFYDKEIDLSLVRFCDLAWSAFTNHRYQYTNKHLDEYIELTSTDDKTSIINDNWITTFRLFLIKLGIPHSWLSQDNYHFRERYVASYIQNIAPFIIKK